MLAGWRLAVAAPDPGHHLDDRRSPFALRWRLHPVLAVRMPDRGQPAADAHRRAAACGLAGEEDRHCARIRRQRRECARRAPGAEDQPVARVGVSGARRPGSLGVSGGDGDLGADPLDESGVTIGRSDRQPGIGLVAIIVRVVHHHTPPPLSKPSIGCFFHPIFYPIHFVRESILPDKMGQQRMAREGLDRKSSSK